MRSIPVAMTWEMLSRGRWSLIGTALSANLMPVLILGALHREGAFEPADQSQITIQMVMVQINMFVFAAGVFVAQGAPARLYASPISTSSLVLWRMLPAMAMVSLESLASTAAMNALFDLAWPLWGPALYVAVAVAAVQATFWLCEKSTWLFWGCGLVVLLLGWWYRTRYGEMLSFVPRQMWSELTVFEFLTLLAFAAISYRVALAGVARNRRGDVLPSMGFIAWLERVFDAAPKSGRPFRSPAEAQFWLEWRRKGGAMPAAVVFGFVLGLSGWLIFSRDPHDLIPAFGASGFLLAVLGLVIGLLMGNIGPNDATFEMGHFRATRPIINSEIARTILKTIAKSLFITWMIWAAAFLVLYLTLLATNSFPQEALPEELTWWYFPATLIGPWIVITALTSVGLAGRSHLFLQLIIAVMTAFFLLLFLGSVMSLQAHLQLLQGVVIVCGGMFILGTTWAFVVAHRRSLIGSATVCTAAGVWAALCALIVLERVRHPIAPIPVFVFVVGLAALAVAPFATAPLAVAWNRNR